MCFNFPLGFGVTSHWRPVCRSQLWLPQAHMPKRGAVLNATQCSLVGHSQKKPHRVKSKKSMNSHVGSVRSSVLKLARRAAVCALALVEVYFGPGGGGDMLVVQDEVLTLPEESLGYGMRMCAGKGCRGDSEEQQVHCAARCHHPPAPELGGRLRERIASVFGMVGADRDRRPAGCACWFHDLHEPRSSCHDHDLHKAMSS